MTMTSLPAAANGWPLVEFPCPWRFVSMDWTASVPITRNVSPTTGQINQIIKWPGADNWKITVTTPPMTVDEARDWTSFAWDVQGGSAAFLLGDPLRRKPRGSVNTPISVNGANAAMTGTLNLRGFTANQPRVLLCGDLIAVNYRLYQIRDRYVSADANGDASVTIGPSLREALTDGMPVTTHDAQGMFTVAKSEVKWTIDENHNYSGSLICIEAR